MLNRLLRDRPEYATTGLRLAIAQTIANEDTVELGFQGAGADKVRDGDQPEDRKGDRA
jgi:hypothetical protein